MKPHIVIVYKDADSAYGMSCPDAPGCFSAADEADDLFALARSSWRGKRWSYGRNDSARMGSLSPSLAISNRSAPIRNGRRVLRAPHL